MTPSPEVNAISWGEQEGAEFQGLFLCVTLDEPLPFAGPQLLHLRNGTLGFWDSFLLAIKETSRLPVGHRDPRMRRAQEQGKI